MSEYWQGFVVAIPIAFSIGWKIGRALLLKPLREMLDTTIEAQRRLIEQQAAFEKHQHRVTETIDEMIARMERDS